MKILAIGDIHGELNALMRVVSFCSTLEFDCVALSGDIGSSVLNAHFRSQNSKKLYLQSIEYVFEILRTFSVPIFFVPGNHDLKEIISSSSHCMNVDILAGNSKTELKGFDILGWGGSRICGDWPYQWDDNKCLSEIKKKYKLQYEGSPSNPQIWLIHNPPYNTSFDINQFYSHEGSESVLSFLNEKRPLLFLCGHIHESTNIQYLKDIGPGINLGSLVGSFYPKLFYDRNQIQLELTFNEHFYHIEILNHQSIKVKRYFIYFDEARIIESEIDLVKGEVRTNVRAS